MQDPACGADYHAPSGPRGQPRPGAGKLAAARFAIERMGFSVRRASGSVWIHGACLAQFDAIAWLVREIMGGRGDLALVVTAPARHVLDQLRRRHPDDVVLASPCAAVGSVERFLSRQRPCVLILLDGESSLGRATLARVRAAGIPVRAMEDGRAGSAGAGALSDALRDLLPPAPAGVAAESWRLPTLRDRVGGSGPWKAVAPLYMRRRIDDWEQLRQRLARPRTVLCLGNGPSSEDPRLAAIDHDCLIRTNWRWRERGFLDQPDIVFVGDAATVHKVRPCIFGLWNKRIEHAILLRHLATRGPFAAMEYITIERLSPLAAEGRWPARPSNGALSIITAAALAPQRLVIGGMDLFLHPDGRYPGAPQARNEYAAAHRLDTELAIIASALREFAGEVVILGDILREHLARYRESVRRAG